MTEDDRITQLFNKIKLTAEEFGREATLLSNRISTLESRLCSLPGKVGVIIEKDDLGLLFGNHKGRGLRLYFWDAKSSLNNDGKHNWYALADTSVERKAKAITLLPELLEKLAQAQVEQLEKQRGALNRAKQVLDKLDLDPKEGE